MNVCYCPLARTRTRSASTFQEHTFVTASQENMKYTTHAMEVNTIKSQSGWDGLYNGKFVVCIGR